MEMHRVTLLRNGIECTCGHETLFTFVGDDLLIQSLAVHHWIEVGHLPPVNGHEQRALNSTIK